MRRITITEALNELKLYDNKIRKAINEGTFVGATKIKSDKVGTISRDAFTKKCESSFQSIIDLIENRRKIKSAIVMSNANTKVVVNGVEMTVAEAIERKTSIAYEVDFLNKMIANNASATNLVTKENAKVDDKVDKLLESACEGDVVRKKSDDLIAAIAKPYHDNNDWEVVDPLKIDDKIKTLTDEIRGFQADIDTCLAISNATTFIEI